MNSDLTILTSTDGTIGTQNITTECVSRLDEKLTDLENKLKATIIEEKEKLEKRCDDLSDENWRNVVQITKYILNKEKALRKEYEKKFNHIWITFAAFSGLVIAFVIYVLFFS